MKRDEEAAVIDSLISLSKINEALAAVIDERTYQDRKWGPLESHPHTLGGWIMLMKRYAGLAIDAWSESKEDTNALHQLRKLAALGVACLQQHWSLNFSFLGYREVLTKIKADARFAIDAGRFKSSDKNNPDVGYWLADIDYNLARAIISSNNNNPVDATDAVAVIVMRCISCMAMKGVVPREPVDFASQSKGFIVSKAAEAPVSPKPAPDASDDKQVVSSFVWQKGIYDGTMVCRYLACFARDHETVEIRLLPGHVSDMRGAVQLAQRFNMNVTKVLVRSNDASPSFQRPIAYVKMEPYKKIPVDGVFQFAMVNGVNWMVIPENQVYELIKPDPVA